MRVDANVSVHQPGEPFGTRCEIKNLNSLRSLGRAIDYEAQPPGRRAERRRGDPPGDPPLERADGPDPTMRVKEDADDYRYFPEPDLVPLEPDDAWIAEIRASMPVLPAERRARLAATAGLEAGSSTMR